MEISIESDDNTALLAGSLQNLGVLSCGEAHFISVDGIPTGLASQTAVRRGVP
jgi:hypothetical protein